MEVVVKKSSKADKKDDAIIDGGKTVSFGGVGVYTQTSLKTKTLKEKLTTHPGMRLQKTGGNQG